MATPLDQRSATLPVLFFKIILETNVERIKLPNKFTGRYGDSLSNPVSLRPPDFRKWVVHWTEENGEIWLENGWKEFVKNYSLSHGYLVVFNYKGTSYIDVLIHDQSGIELDYFSSAYGSVNTVNATVQKTRPRPKSLMVSSQPRKETPRGGQLIMAIDPNVQELHAGVSSDQGTKVRKIIKHQPKCVNAAQIGTCLNMPEKQRAQEITKIFKSIHPFFTLEIEPSNLEENAFKDVPKFLDCMNCEKTVMLRVKNRSWGVKLICDSERPCDRFSSGWSMFARESKLKAGNICVFEVINPAFPLLQVHVYKS